MENSTEGFSHSSASYPGPDEEGGSVPGHNAISKHSFTRNQIVLGVTRKSNSGGCNVQGKKRERGMPERKVH